MNITGTSNADNLWGTSGDDSMDGLAGADYLSSAEGNDVVYAGTGDDTVIGGTGNDTVYGGAGNDILYGTSGTDTLDGGAGNDTIYLYSNATSGRLLGGEGDDTVYASVGSGVYIDGGDGSDELHLYSGATSGTILGGNGNDALYGGTGNDTLDGGAGNDALSGGSGNDYFIIRDRNDVVSDSGGVDSGIIYTDFYKTESDIENWSWAAGVQRLPYWIDALLPGDAPGFPSLLGDARTFYYCFPATAPDYFSGNELTTFLAFNDSQKSFVRQALAYACSVVDINFVETTDASGLNTLVFANSYQATSAAQAYYPSASAAGSDVALGYNSPGNLSPRDGDYAALTLIHEIGHALGLKHTFAEADAGGYVAPGPVLPDSEENTTWSVMSYTKSSDQYHLKYSPFDIAALQYLYGPSTQLQTNDTYTLQASSTNILWDGGGTDTIDGSALTQSLVLYLEAGYWGYIGSKSSLISAAGQVTVNFGTTIENGYGGSGNDTITGNGVANRLMGNAGADTLSGGAGNDTLDGGAGTDVVVYSGALSAYTLTLSGSGYLVRDNAGSEGSDTVLNIERLQFSDGAVELGMSTPTLSTTLNNAGYVSGNRPSLSGTADGNATIRIYSGTTLLGTSTSNSSGTWSFTPSTPLVDGSYTLTAQAANVSGALSPASAGFVIKVDATAPTAPTIAASLNTMGYASGNRPVLTGTAEANSSVEIFNGNTRLGTTTASATGTWSYTPSTALTDGTRTLTAKAGDAAGNLSAASSALTVKIDTAAPAAPTIAVTLNTMGYASGNRPVVSGTAEANSTVEVFNGSTRLGTASAGATGAWSFTPAAALADGVRSLTAKAGDAAGNLSVASAALTVKIDTVAPSAPTISSVLNAAGYASSNRPELTGTAEANSTVEIFNGSIRLGTTTAGATGTWSMTPSSALADGSYVLSAKAIDQAGNQSSASSALGLRIVSPVAVAGSSGNETLSGGAGNDSIDGGAGIDTLSFRNSRSDYRIQMTPAGSIKVEDRTGVDGSDLLVNVENLAFSDGVVNVDYTAAVQALYIAYFGRAADSGGLAGFQAQLAASGAPRDVQGLSTVYGMNDTVRALVDAFGTSNESRNLYTGETRAFVTAVFNNVLGRDPALAGLAFWENAIDHGGLSRGNAALSIMAGALGNSSSQGLIDAALVRNKIAVAANFTFAMDTSAEINAYRGSTAAATVRSMLSTLRSDTATEGFQQTVESTLASLATVRTPAYHDAAAEGDSVQLIGVAPDSWFG